MTGTGAKKLSQISWSTSSTGYPRIDTRIDMKTTQGKPVLFSSIAINSRIFCKISQFLKNLYTSSRNAQKRFDHGNHLPIGCRRQPKLVSTVYGPFLAFFEFPPKSVA